MTFCLRTGELPVPAGSEERKAERAAAIEPWKEKAAAAQKKAKEAAAQAAAAKAEAAKAAAAKAAAATVPEPVPELEPAAPEPEPEPVPISESPPSGTLATGEEPPAETDGSARSSLGSTRSLGSSRGGADWLAKEESKEDAETDVTDTESAAASARVSAAAAEAKAAAEAEVAKKPKKSYKWEVKTFGAGAAAKSIRPGQRHRDIKAKNFNVSQNEDEEDLPRTVSMAVPTATKGHVATQSLEPSKPAQSLKPSKPRGRSNPRSHAVARTFDSESLGCLDT